MNRNFHEINDTIKIEFDVRSRIGGCDNGGSFQTKISEDKIEKLLKDTELLMRNASNTQTAYTLEIPRLDQPCYTSTG